MVANTPKPPYYTVIFTSVLDVDNTIGYEEMAKEMVDLAAKQPGFLGVESVRKESGITVSYWRDLDSIAKWKENSDHKTAKERGKKLWYKSFKTRIASVEIDY